MAITQEMNIAPMKRDGEMAVYYIATSKEDKKDYIVGIGPDGKTGLASIELITTAASRAKLAKAPRLKSHIEEWQNVVIDELEGGIVDIDGDGIITDKVGILKAAGLIECLPWDNIVCNGDSTTYSYKANVFPLPAIESAIGNCFECYENEFGTCTFKTYGSDDVDAFYSIVANDGVAFKEALECIIQNGKEDGTVTTLNHVNAPAEDFLK